MPQTVNFRVQQRSSIPHSTSHIAFIPLDSRKPPSILRYKYIYTYARQLLPCQQTPGPPGLRHLQPPSCPGAPSAVPRTRSFSIPRTCSNSNTKACGPCKQDHYSLAQAASEFGLSRPTLYQAREHFPGRGARRPPARQARSPQSAQAHPGGAGLCAGALADPTRSDRRGNWATRVRQRFHIKVHPRTIEKALNPKAKRGRRK